MGGCASRPKDLGDGKAPEDLPDVTPAPAEPTADTTTEVEAVESSENAEKEKDEEPSAETADVSESKVDTAEGQEAAGEDSGAKEDIISKDEEKAEERTNTNTDDEKPTQSL